MTGPTYAQLWAERDKGLLTAMAEFDLHQAGLTWATNNNGNHLMIYKDGVRVADLWPTTGKWKMANKKYYNNGLDKLINALTKL